MVTPLQGPARVRGRLALVLPLVLIAAPVVAQQGQRYALSGDEVVIYDIAGEVEVGRTTGSDVEVYVQRGGDAADRLSIATGEIEGRQTLRVMYPSDQIRYGSSRWSGNTSIRVRDDGTFGRGGHRVRIRSGGGLDAHADLRILVPDGRRVAVFLGVGRVQAAGMQGDLLLNVASADVTASRIRGAMLIDTGSGSAQVDDFDGALSIDTGSGSVRLSGVRGRSLKVDTGSGSVSVDGARVEELSLDTGSGGIKAMAVDAPKLKLDTGSGGITLELLSDVEDAVLDTGSGSVHLRLPDGLGARLDVSTGSGGIDIGVPMQLTKKEHGELHGTLGDGQGRLYIDTGSGSVRIVKGEA